MRTLVAAITLACAITCVSCKKQNPNVGSGVQKTETRSVPPFEKLRVSGTASVEVTIGPPCPAEVITDDNLLDRVTTQLEAGVLRVNNGPDLRPKVPIRVRLCAAGLSELGVEGAGQVKVAKLSTAALVVRAAGAGKVELSGSAASLDGKLGTASTLDATQLPIGSATLHVDQAASAQLGHVEKLTVTIPGPGTVRYRGEPELTRNVGKLARLIGEK